MRVLAHSEDVRDTVAVPPEAELVRTRRESTLPFMSRTGLAEAVTAAGTKLSEASLRKIEKGEYAARPHILAAIALTLGITPDELEALGRRHDRDNATKAALMLREYVAERARQEPAIDQAAASLPEAALQAVVAGIDEIRATRGLSRQQREALVRALVASTVAHVNAEMDRLRTTLDIVREPQ